MLNNTQTDKDTRCECVVCCAEVPPEAAHLTLSPAEGNTTNTAQQSQPQFQWWSDQLTSSGPCCRLAFFQHTVVVLFVAINLLRLYCPCPCKFFFSNVFLTTAPPRHPCTFISISFSSKAGTCLSPGLQLQEESQWN